MSVQLLHVGFGNFLAVNRVVAISSPDSAPIKRRIQEARARNAVIDLTRGRRLKTVVFLDTGEVVLAALTPETVASRVSSEETAARRRNAEDKQTNG